MPKTNHSQKVRQLSMNAIMAAMCAVLGYLSLDLGNLKVTFESLPILVSALLFGPADGMIVGGIGTLIYQLLRYGVSITTPLWMLPYIVCGSGWLVCKEERVFPVRPPGHGAGDPERAADHRPEHRRPLY